MASNDLKKDIAELMGFLEKAERQRVKDALSLQIRKWQTQLIEEESKKQAEEAKKQAEEKKEETMEVQAEEQSTPSATATKPTVKKSIVKELRQYAWDQSDKFMKIYVDMPGIHTVPQENIKADFQTKYVKLIAQVENFTYSLAVGPFHSEAIAEQCKYKVKTDKVVVMLKKKKEQETWPYMVSKNIAAKKGPAGPKDPNADPGEGLMDMLKKMYDEGDDQMKRTIGEAYYKSQTKKGLDPSSMDL